MTFGKVDEKKKDYSLFLFQVQPEINSQVLIVIQVDLFLINEVKSNRFGHIIIIVYLFRPTQMIQN
jgi:hypothetical protein